MLAAKVHKPSLVDTLFPDAGELNAPLRVVEGAVPADLRGVLYQNRPRTSAYDPRTRHWLDGDGLVSRLHFGPNGVTYLSRFVRTKRHADSATSYATFSSHPKGSRLRMGLTLEPQANIHAQVFDGKLYALGEQSPPWELDPTTLETKGEAFFGGLLSPLAPFSAHAKVHGGEWVNFGIEYHPQRPRLHAYFLGSDPRSAAHPLDGPRAAHDFAVTPAHSVLYLPPYFLDLPRLLGGAPVIECLRWQPERALKLMLIDRRTLDVRREIDTESRYALHTANAFEGPEGTSLDVVEYDGPLYGELFLDRFFSSRLPARLVRYTLGRSGSCRREILSDYDRMLDFPVADPTELGNAPTRYWGLGCSAAHSLGDKFYDELWRWTPERTDVFPLPAGHWFSGDPIVAGNWLVVFVAAPEASEYWVFPKEAPRSGPATRLRLPAVQTIPVHGTFVSDN